MGVIAPGSLFEAIYSTKAIDFFVFLAVVFLRLFLHRVLQQELLHI